MKKPKRPNGNVHSIMHLLSANEKAVLTGCIRDHTGRLEIHVGLLPFIGLTTAREAVVKATSVKPTSKILKALLYKVLPIRQAETDTFNLHLDDGKVAKRFGRHPELGKLLPNKTKVTVGVRWSLPLKDYEPDDDVLVSHTMALTPIKKGLWRVSVHKKLAGQATRWLLDYCT